MEPLAVAAIVVAAVVIAGAVGYRIGRGKPPSPMRDRRLEEYDFYPFQADERGHIEFSPQRFQEAVERFLHERNVTAARELIVIGEQNFVRDTFGTTELNRYRHLYEAYDGDSVISDNEAFLESYKRIVRLLGRSFPNTGIEILLHNLVNPAKSIVAIEGGEVTGRALEMGTTNLVLDLKTRRHQNQDKLNYELNIGARQFKCTTIPIFRPEYGLVGAICINVDSHFLREEVKTHPEKLEAFFDNFLRTDMQLQENILSRDEYQAAIRGKRHYLDEAIRGAPASAKTRQLAVIMFSDIVGYSSLMVRDEDAALVALASATKIQRQEIADADGRLLKEMGDGILASFSSVADAVECARRIQSAARDDGRFQLRIGIHLGEVIQSEGDVFGDGVNIASRIHEEAAPGTIAVSEAVFTNVRNKPGIVATELGLRELKNIDQPVRIYAIGV